MTPYEAGALFLFCLCMFAVWAGSVWVEKKWGHRWK